MTGGVPLVTQQQAASKTGHRLQEANAYLVEEMEFKGQK
jgi:hypothetical protein